MNLKNMSTFKLIGIIISIIIIVISINIIFITSQFNKNEKLTNFLVPSTEKFAIVNSGEYALYYNNKIIYNNIVFNKPEQLPDKARITIIDEETGKQIPINMTPGWITSSNQYERREIATFLIAKPGNYSISTSRFPEQLVFSFGLAEKNSIPCLIIGAIISFGVALIGFITVIMIMIILFKRNAL